MRTLPLFLLPCLLSAQVPLGALSNQFQELVDRTSPAVVQILVRSYAAGNDEAPGVLRTARGNGSGTIVSTDGHIITNAHVVANARRIQVLLPVTGEEAQTRRSILKASGKLVDATLTGLDRETDIAVLKIAGEALPAVPFGDSESVRQGHIVFAFGSPLGLDNSVTMGIVSSVARQVRPDDPMIYIQTDAAINPGNSGGPLVDSHGRLVGVNTFILSPSGGSDGIGFAVPSNIVKTVYDQIREHGRVRRGQIGVLAQTITPTLAAALELGRDAGVLLEDVTPGSPAAAAGLKVGDIVLTLEGKPIENARQFGVNIYQNAGKTIHLSVLRGGQTRPVAVAVLERPRDPDRLLTHVSPDRSRIRKLGILAVDLDDKVTSLFQNLRDYTGAVVAGVTADLALEANHLQPGDIIHRVNQKVVLNVEALREAVEPMAHGQPVALHIERGGQLMYLLLEID
ncbi:MAG: trypsin-like peptidase domain-containing protein [Acidobacteria bacterium]|nr:trypsin-like peptidase domain-containing protein [Acidobacteriota bacterium]